MLIRIPVSKLQQLSKNAPVDYFENVTKSGTINNDMLSIEYGTYRKLWEHYRIGAEPPPPPSTPPGSPCPSPRAPGISAHPGTLLSLIIKKLTGFDSNRCCRCAGRVRQMNQWGWWESWLNRKIIATWLAEEARHRGHQINGSSALDLLKAACRELCRQRPGKPSALPLQTQ